MTISDAQFTAFREACAGAFLSRHVKPGIAEEIGSLVSPSVFAAWSREEYGSQDEVGKLAWLLLVQDGRNISLADIEVLRWIRNLYISLEGPQIDGAVLKKLWRAAPANHSYGRVLRLFLGRLRFTLALYEAGVEMDRFPRCAALVRQHLESLIKSMAQ